MAKLPDENRAPAPGRSAKVLTQVVLPLAIFVVVVAGITFVSQYGAGRRDTPADKKTSEPDVIPLAFREKPTRGETGPVFVTVWDPTDPGFVPEFENKEGRPQYREGRYYFLYWNEKDTPVELGFTYKTCTCAHARLCSLTTDEAKVLTGPLGPRGYLGPLGAPGALHLINQGYGGPDGVSTCLHRKLDWTELGDNYKEGGIVVNPGSGGLIRLTWDGAKRESIRLRLRVDLWAQLRDQPRTRKRFSLGTLLPFVPPVRTYPEQLSFDDWTGNVNRGEFYCWSSTRPAFSVTAKSDDPCVETEVSRLSADECPQLAAEMNKANNAPAPGKQASDYTKRVVSAHRVRVTVYRRKGDAQLEQGHFRRWIRLRSQDVASIDPVAVSGYVPSDVTVEGDQDDRGKINLGSFRASQGKMRRVFLVANPGVELLPEKTQTKPPFLKVKLTREKGAPGGQTRWQLVVEVPPTNAPAPWPKDSAIILHTKQEDQDGGRIRVPVLANPYKPSS